MFRKLLILLTLFNQNCSSRTIVEYCPQLQPNTLTLILGSAYNPRYMSIDEPPIKQEPTVMGNKRSSSDDEFFVDNNFHKELSNKPAWEVQHNIEKSTNIHHNRNKRSLEKSSKNDSTIKRRDSRQIFLDSVVASPKEEIFRSRPWECKARIRWMDLGYDYFPRYLRTVECMKKECWYGHFTCKPRSFTVKVLRRRNGECARISEKLMATMDQKTGEFTELWVWEEKAVNFCCDCVMS